MTRSENKPTHTVTRSCRLLLEAPAPARRFTSDALHRIEARCACRFPWFATRLERCHRHHEVADLLVITVHATNLESVAALALDLFDPSKVCPVLVEAYDRVVAVDGSLPPEKIAHLLGNKTARP